MTDEELVAFVTEFREGILDGDSPKWMCFAVCAPLATLLGLYGVNVEIIESDLGEFNHVWMRLPDGRALDPTADQFNNYEFMDCGFPEMPPVYLGPPAAMHPIAARTTPTETQDV
jgi:hypothetical protein